MALRESRELVKAESLGSWKGSSGSSVRDLTKSDEDVK
jgi:hypothetical protein